MVTEFAQFYRAINAQAETRYYPHTANSRTVARQFDAQEDPPVVSGYGAYDTSVSTEYAVALYATKEEAEAHEVVSPPKVAESIFDETPVEEADMPPADPDDEETPEEPAPVPARKSPFGKRRGR
jgi:hypothetical protein